METDEHRPSMAGHHPSMDGLMDPLAEKLSNEAEQGYDLKRLRSRTSRGQDRERRLAALNSASKYPSIPTYHTLDPGSGLMLEGADGLVRFTSEVIVTEKVDGANARVIRLPHGGWLIGSRDELLTMGGDVIYNRAHGMVDALRDIAEVISTEVEVEDEEILTFYFEVHGQRGQGSGAGARAYNEPDAPRRSQVRLFDVAVLPMDVMRMTAEQAASWRDHGGQRFLVESELAATSLIIDVPLTARLGVLSPHEMPRTLSGTLWSMNELLREGHLSAREPDLAEGVVFRSPDRSVIAKAHRISYLRSVKAAATDA